MSDRQYPALRTPMGITELTPVIPAAYANAGMSPSQVFSVLRAYRLQILLIFITVVALTVVALKFWPRTYTAGATLWMNYEISDPVDGQQLPNELLSHYMATQVDLVRDMSVLLAVVDRLKLTEREQYRAGYNSIGTLREWAARKVGERLSVTRARGRSQMIYVSYSSGSPKEAAEIANAVADVYKELSARQGSEPSARAEQYNSELEALRTRVEDAQRNLAAFHQRKGLTEHDYKGGDINLLSALEQRLAEAEHARRAAEARAAGNQAVGDAALSSGLIQSLKTQLAAREAERAELGNTLGPRHPRMLELDSQIAATRSSLAAEQGRYSANAGTTLQAARQLENSLRRARDEEHAKVLAMSRAREEGGRYFIELESAKALYKAALDEYDVMLAASRSDITNVGFLSRAAPPVQPSSPRMIRSLMFGCIAAVALAIGLPFAQELLRRRVRCRDDFERDHGVPVLAELHRLPRQRSFA